MCFKKGIMIFVFAAITVSAAAQDSWYGSFSGMYVMYNPSFAGSSGKSSLKTSCYSFLPGAGYKLNSVYASWDDFIESLHGGVAIWASDDMQGDVMNDLRTGFSYSYHLKAGPGLYFNAGITASAVHLGINRSAVIFPGDYDPYGGLTGVQSETVTDAGITLFDIGTGFCVSSGPWYGGLSIMHLTQPFLSSNQQNHNRIRRLYTINAGVSLPFGHSDGIIQPSVECMIQGTGLIVNIGAVATLKELAFGLSAWYIKSGISALEPSLGWSFNTTNITLSYSYCVSGRSAGIPGTAVIKAGLGVCFNNVNKRKVVHIIKLPEL